MRARKSSAVALRLESALLDLMVRGVVAPADAVAAACRCLIRRDASRADLAVRVAQTTDVRPLLPEENGRQVLNHLLSSSRHAVFGVFVAAFLRIAGHSACGSERRVVQSCPLS